MAWYLYIASFFAGVFLANAIPHFIQGVSGNRFPSPFSKPSGRGLSSPIVNVVWALCNFLVGYLFLRMGQISSGNTLSLVMFFVGVTAISIMSSINFQKKERD
jgi:hypothetical protein